MTNGSAYASGNWHVRAGSEEEFMKRWEEFLTWTRDHVDGLDSARLVQNVDDPTHFVSIAQWQSADARSQWKSSSGFSERFTACRELCDRFEGGDFDGVRMI